jgi:hypothetical protein
MSRASAASLTVLKPKRKRPRLAPSAEAPDDVVAVFGEIVAATPDGHFRASDSPLIQGYAEAIVLARQAAAALAREGPVIGGRASPWIVVQEKAHRSLASLSMRLRLSPQHRADSRSAGRRADQPPSSVYAMMDEMDDGD